jgi:SAM-dependent methyltransferase
MDVKGTLKAITLELRHELEGRYDAHGSWQPGDLERRLAAVGVRRDRGALPIEELPYLAPEDREARRVVDAFVKSRVEAGQNSAAALAEFVRDAAYTWANRLLALRCMEARSLIDEVILQKSAYGGRSLQHNRLAKKQPERCVGEDEGLFAMLFDEFARRAEELPLLFDPRSPDVALRPSVAALKRCVALLSGTLAVKGQEAATDEVFTAPDALGWTYQYWNTEEKDRVFKKVRTKKGSKIEGAEIIPATCIYTEPYMVKFLVQNSLGALWRSMHPNSHLADKWQYYVPGADRAPVSKKAVSDITFLDPACGSGHFLIEAFELFYAMYLEEGVLTEPTEICASVLERNLYGIDIDERAVQIAALALVMKAKEKTQGFVPRRVNLVATNIHLPAGKEHLEAFLRKHPEDTPLKPALQAIFESLTHADELGSLLQIEEPLDRELKILRERFEAAGSPAQQQTLWVELQTPVQGRLPVGVPTYEAWKQGVVNRLRDHFEAEMRDNDLAAAFFGEAASKGLSLLDLLARRYDIVAANPPYMGSKNMGPVLRNHVERHFSQGKGDIYAAFILRCLQLAGPSGRVTMVTQQSWMFQRSYADLRALEDEKLRKSPRAFRGILRETTIETLAHLGSRAFAEIGGEVVSSTLFTLSRQTPPPEHRLTAFRVVGARGPEEKDTILQAAIASMQSGGGRLREGIHPSVSRPAQGRLLSIPQAPLCYWLRDRFFELLAGRTLKDVADVCQGLATADDPRFVRFTWEAPVNEWCRSPRDRRWSPFEKGGGYGRWYGHHYWTVDWQYDGRRLKQITIERYGNAGKRIYNEDRYFTEGWTFSITASGSLGLRVLKDAVFSTQSAGVMLRHKEAVAAIANARLSSALIRGMTAQMYLRESYVARLPCPEHIAESLMEVEAWCVALKTQLVAEDLCERSYLRPARSGDTLSEMYRHATDRAEGVAAVLHALEGVCEREVAAVCALDAKDLRAVADETGDPGAWFPLLPGYDSAHGFPTSIEGWAASLDLDRHARRALSGDELDDRKRHLRALYEIGPGTSGDENDSESALEDAADDEADVDEGASGAQVRIPAETFLEELSQKLEIHPISVYWLLHEMREKDRVISKPELVRFAEDYLSVVVLRLLGHQWPGEVEGHETVATWSDEDGIIPLTEGTREPALIARVRDRLAEDFRADRVGAVEREFQEIIGRPLAAWLTSDFFKRHISQFRKRPIAWHLTSAAASNGKGRGRGISQNAPAFACLVYYHRLNTDLLPKLRTQYIGPLRASLQTELGALEKMPSRSADQDARRVELDGRLEELKSFDARLERVILEGFASLTLDKVAAKEPLDKWTSRDGRSRTPETQDAFFAQERRYEPDLNDGVRVNIAPLQRAGLLAADVLPAKDLEKAITDRSEWRAHERRWCRDGKLPQPGWWASGRE